jgi:pseudouridine-5'-phosphate glycosidase/pseudouridine kinase
MDISADLTELGRTPIAVVCSGAKSILDIEKTLEYLETQGVTVVSFGDSNDFPSFYTRSSGFKAMANISTPEECANMIRANNDLNINSGMVIAVPIPEADELKNADKVERLIHEAAQQLPKLGIKGKDITPFLLDKMKQMTMGDSLRANIALIKNNAKVGAQIALCYANKEGSTNNTSAAPNDKGRPFIIGGSVLDITSKYIEPPIPATSNLGKVQYSCGGVGRNVAEACFKTGADPFFLSYVGNDFAGESIMNDMKLLNLVFNFN